MYTGTSLAPSMIMASKPQFFMRTAVSPPMCASTMALYLVKGDRDEMVMRPEQGALEPVLGPTAKTILFSGAAGSVPTGTSSYIMRLAMPLPPIYLKYFSLLSMLLVLVVRLTRSRLPIHPFMDFTSF